MNVFSPRTNSSTKSTTARHTQRGFMKNLTNVIRSRAARFVSLRVVLILFAAMVVVGFGVASAWNGGFDRLSIRKASAESARAKISQNTTSSTGASAKVQSPLLIGIPVTVSGTAVTSPALAATYTSLTDALVALNAVTAYPTPGTVIFTLSAGSEIAPTTGLTIGSTTLNPLLSSTNTVTIIATPGTATLNAGVGAAASPSATPDAIMKLTGADFVTIDGLTFTDGNSASATVAMEVGLGLFKLNAGDGSHDNTIQNCTFNMQRISNGGGTTPMLDGSWAIEVVNSTAAAATTALTPTNGGTSATNGTNSNNKFYANTINGGNGGIGFGGFAATSGVGPAPTATTFLGDLGNDVGGVALATGNTILNFGGGAATSPSAGIRANNEWSVNISFNTVNNNNGAGVNHATTFRGIYAQAGTSANATINNNILTIQSGATTSTVSAIENVIGSTAAANTVTINTNTINVNYSTATTGVYNGILNGSTAAVVNINGNIITKVAGGDLAGTGTDVMIETGSPTTVTANSNSITNITRSGASGSWRGIKMTSPTNFTANTNTIDGLSWTAAASTGGIDAIYSISSAVNVTASGNFILNLSTPTTGTITGINEFGVSGLKTYQNNQIHNFSTTAGGAGGGSFRGISESTGSTNTYSGNLIYSLNSTGSTGGTTGTIVGITFSSGTTNNATNNAIYDLSSTSTGPTVNGITIGGGTTNNVNNNLIGDLRATASTGNTTISGIQSSSGTTNNIFHNTVNVASTTASVTTFGSSAIYFSSSSPVNNLRNNIFVNTSSPGPTGGFTAAIRWTVAPTSTNFPAANNNNFYYAGIAAANKVLYGEGSAAAATNGQQTISAYKTYINTTLPVAGRESASVSEIPNFVSTTGSNPITTFLKYNTGIATQIEQGGGLGTGITTDYSGVTVRCPGGGCPGAASTPDIGAWELAGTPLDLSAPVISYAVLGNGAANAIRAFANVTITDATGVNTTAGTRPRVYYRKTCDPSTTFNDNTSGTAGWKYAEANGTTSPFDFTINYALFGTFGTCTSSGVATGDTIQYFVVAQDTVTPTPNVGINSGTFNATPTSVALTPAAFPIGGTINSYAIAPALASTITVDAGGAINSITNPAGLFATLNAGILTGNVTVNITSDLLAETGAVVLNQLAEDPVGNFTVTIKASGAARTISGTSATGLITLNGADRVVFDGTTTAFAPDFGSGDSDTMSDTLRPELASNNLTITNTNVGVSSAVIWVQTATGSNGATSNTFRKLNINGSGGTQTLIGIGFGGTTISVTSLGAGNNTNRVEGCDVRAVQTGIYTQGASAAAKNTGNVITQNILTAATPNNIGRSGIMAGFEDAIQVTQNSVSNISVATSGIDAMGIALGFVGTGPILNTSTTGNEVTNPVVSRNTIGSITQTATYSSCGICMASAASGTATIDNNVITGVTGTGTVGDFHAGMFLGGGAGASTKIYFNSISMNGTSASSSSQERSYGLAINGSNPVLDIRDNIFYNTQVLTGSTSVVHAIGLATATFTNLTANGNDYFTTTGALFAVGRTGNLDDGGTDDVLFSDWTTATGKDTPNSISVDPLFNNPASNLQPGTGSPVVDTGVSLVASLSPYVDITGATRVDLPSMGAYETAVDTVGPVITYTAFANTSSTSNRILSATITDGSGVASGLNSPRVYFKKSTELGYASTQCGAPTGNVYPCTIDYTLVGGGSVTTGDTVQYFVVAQDTLGNVSSNPSAGFTGTSVNSVTTPPTTPNSYLIAVAYSGTLTVPGTAASLTNAGGIFALLNAGVLTGNTTVLIGADLAGELGTVALNQLAEEGAGGYTLIIKPTGAARAITGTSSASAGLIKLNGADRVTIDGSLSGGTDRSLSITNSTASGVVVWIASAGAANGANNDTIKNCNLIGSAGIGGTVAGVLAGSGSVFGSAAEAQNNNNTIQNNLAIKVQNGAFISGFATTLDQNWVVTGNTFGSTTVAEKLGFRGMLIGNAQNMLVSGNSILGVVSDPATTATMSGIQVAFAISGGSITGNLITDIKQTNPSGWGCNGINLNASTTASNLLISNNTIWDVAAAGFADVTVIDNGYGIIATTGGGYKVYENTVYMNTEQPSGGFPAAMNVAAAVVTVGSLDVRDNIFASVQTIGTPIGFIDSSTAGNTIFSIINANDYFAPNVGRFGATPEPFLANWQGATGQDGASIASDPFFVAPFFAPTAVIDLHIQPGSPCIMAGILVAGVDNDIDNDMRDTVPDIGSDEIPGSGRFGSIPGGTFRDAALGAGNVTSNLTLTGNLSLAGGVVNTELVQLSLISCTPITVSGAGVGAWVQGNMTRTFCSPSAFSFPLGKGAYSPLDVNATAVAVNPSTLAVRVDTGAAPSTPPMDPNAIQRYWTVTETGDLTANMVMHYQQTDCPGAETNFQVFRIEGSNPTSFPNSCPSGPACVDTVANTGTINGVFNFSRWLVGPPLAPTNTEANISGHVVDNMGAPLAGVTMTLLDTVLVENRTTVTDGNGNYFFNAILTGREIVVTPQKNGYTFNPANRAFNHTGDIATVDFVGTSSGQTRSVGSDFDGDGKADLAVFRPSDATWYILLSSTGTFKSQQWGLGTDRIVPADYDGDHVIDVAVFRPSTGTWYINQSSTTTLRAVNWGLAEDVVTPADFDGDGQADIAVWRPSTGTWYIIDSHNGQTRTIQWGTLGDRPVAADYDGDGKADCAVWRPSTGTWYVLNTDGTYTHEHWGIEEDRAVVGDYDGDNKADLAVFRPSTATWYVKLSSDGSINSRGHGTAADILTPGDYDGDGKMDRAVWQLGGDWNILRSTTNTAYGQKWGTAGDIPTTSAYVR